MAEPLRRIPWPTFDSSNPEALVTREWLVTNGLGGYASGSVAGAITRRYHGLLIAAIPAPFGRTVMLSHVAEQMLREFSADKLFVGAAGCDVTFGLSTPTLEEARVGQAMTKVARERILVADSSKFCKRALCRIVELSEINTVITDRGLTESLQKQIRAQGPDLILT